jgi:heat shock protein HspQ
MQNPDMPIEPPDSGYPLFRPGQLVKHKRYGYRGVIVDLDPCCTAEEGWYASNQTQPERNQPWYHVLVHNSESITYPAQENLVADRSNQPINHSLIEVFFSSFVDGHYIRNDCPWPV